MNQSKKLELSVGAFLLIGFAALLFLVMKVADVHSWGQTNTYTLHAQFENIGGLKVRAPIKVGGVTVGEVTGITLDSDTFLPQVTMAMNREFGSFPETSSASILTSGLLGEQYIGIRPGFMDEDIMLLDDGSFIEDTKSALVLEDMIGQVLYSLGGDQE